MNFIQSLFPEELIETIGWTLFHSLWQATVVLLILVFVLFLMKKYSPRVRYLIAFSGLIICLIISAFTAHKSYTFAKEKVAIRETLINNPLELKELLKSKLSIENGSGSSPIFSSINTIKFRAFMQRNFPIVFALWILGMFYFLFRMVGGVIHLQQLRTRQITIPEEFWLNKFNEISDKLGITKSVELLQSAVVKIPMLLGYFKPVVILPISLMTGLSNKEIEAVIAHELAHLKRHDYLFNIIQSVIEAVFFYHPAVWLISRIIRNEREHSCDDLAIQCTGDKLNYIKALATAQELNTKSSPNYAMAFSINKGGLLDRVKRIKNQNTMKNNVTEGFIAASIIFFSLILLSFTIDGENLKRELDTIPRPQSLESGPSKPAKVDPPPKVNTDSINRVIEDKVLEAPEVPEEMEQLMEIAYTQNNEELSQLINESLELAFKEIEMTDIMETAMEAANSALSEIDINQIISEAMEEAKTEIAMEVDVPEIALDALEIARTTMEAVDLGGIIEMAMQQASIAIQAIDMEDIMQDAMIESQEAIMESQEAMFEAQEAMKESQEAMFEAQETMKQTEQLKHKAQKAITEEEKARIKEEIKEAQKEIQKAQLELEKMAKEMQKQESEMHLREREKNQDRTRERSRTNEDSKSDNDKTTDMKNQLIELEDEK